MMSTGSRSNADRRPNTESRDRNLADLDLRSTGEIVGTLVASHNLVLATGTMAKPQLTELVDVATAILDDGGRMIYVGAGSAGMIAELDASELAPTFGIDEETVFALVAGSDLPPGTRRAPVEDDAEAGRLDLEAQAPGEKDLVIGVSASGSTAYVMGALQAAAAAGSTTAAVVSALDSPMSAFVDHPVEVPVGPEVIAGSTRLKAGSAQKLALNAISTATMIKLGRTYGNLMVAVQAENDKLRRRAVDICRIATDCSTDEAEKAIDAAGGDQRVALVMLLTGAGAEKAMALLAANHGSVRRAVQNR